MLRYLLPGEVATASTARTQSRRSGQCLQVHIKYQTQFEQHPPYSPHLLGLALPPTTPSPEQPAAPMQEDAPASPQEQVTAPPGSTQQVAQGAAQFPEKLAAPHSLPGNIPAGAQQHSVDSMAQAAQGTSLGALASSPSGASHAAQVQQETPAAGRGEAGGEARLAGDGAQASGSGTTLTQNSAHADEALSRAPALTHGAGGIGAQPGQVDDNPAGVRFTAPGQQQTADAGQPEAGAIPGVSPAQMLSSSACMRSTAAGQQQSQGGGQCEVGADTGEASEGCCSPQPPGEGRADAWRPTVEGPVHSVTEVACMHLLPDFLTEISQVAVTAVFSLHPCYGPLFQFVIVNRVLRSRAQHCLEAVSWSQLCLDC